MQHCDIVIIDIRRNVFPAYRGRYVAGARPDGTSGKTISHRVRHSSPVSTPAPSFDSVNPQLNRRRYLEACCRPDPTAANGAPLRDDVATSQHLVPHASLSLLDDGLRTSLPTPGVQSDQSPAGEHRLPESHSI